MATGTMNVTVDWVLQEGTSIEDRFEEVAVGPDGNYILAGDSYYDGDLASDETGRIVVKIDADGTEVWRYQDTNAKDKALEGLAVDQRDGSVVFAGNGPSPAGSSSSTDTSGASTFAVVKLDPDGNVLWEYEEDTGDSGSFIRGMTMAEDGSMVLVGYTYGAWDGVNAGETDLAALRLDTNGTEIWRYQDGSLGVEKLKSAAMADGDTSVVVVGNLEDDLGDPDYVFAIKLDASDGTEIWRYEDETSLGRYLNGVAETEDGSIVLAGSAIGTMEGMTDDQTADYSDFSAVKLNSEGVELWRYQDGTLYPDWFAAVEEQPDGSLLFVGATGGSWSGVNSEGVDGSTKDLALVLLSADGEEIWRWQAGSGDEDDFTTIVGGSDGRVLVAGCTSGSWGQPNSGDTDFVALMLNTSTAPTPAPSTIAPTIPPSEAPIFVAPSLVPSTVSPAGTAAPNTPLAPTTMTSSAPISTSPAPTLASLAPTPTPSRGGGATSDSTAMIAGVSAAVGAAILVALGALRWRHMAATKKRALPQSHSPRSRGFDHQPEPEQPLEARFPSIVSAGGSDGPYPQVKPAEQPGHIDTRAKAEGSHQESLALSSTSAADKFTLPLPSISSTAPATQAPPAVARSVNTSRGQTTLPISGSTDDRASRDAEKQPAEESTTATVSTATLSTVERAEVDHFNQNQDVASAASTAHDSTPGNVDDSKASSSARRQRSLHGMELGHAILAAAQDLARHCQVPGISEAAAVLCIMANLVTDSRENDRWSDSRLRQCRAIVVALKRADKVVGKGGNTTGEAARILIEDVHDSIYDLVELIQIFNSKNKLSKLFLSTLFKRRQEELDAVVDRAIMRLQLGLQVQVGHDVSSVKNSVEAMEGDVSAVRDGVKAVEEGMHLYKATSESVAEARSRRRQRKLDQVEIPEDHLFITSDLLGKGGFGEVYLADYNGHNAAAKVLYIAHDLGALDENHKHRETKQRRAFLRELEAMIRLRSPNTVNVFGAVTSLPDRMVLVMELLPNGDLLTLLRKSKEPLPEEQSRRIIGDICAGMAFLHSRNTVHGDLKSANVLLDGGGRAKIGDFGTSRWSQHTNSTGLATYTTKGNQNTQMSLAWSAPEVLESGGSTYKSDVYSFGIVVWEVLSRELPWANKTRPRDILSAVLMGVRPSFHVDAPADVVDIAKACWGGEPEERTTFSAILEGMKAKG